MAFMDELLSLVGLDKEIIPFPFRITLLGKNSIFIEGVKSIERFTEEKVELKLKSNILCVDGKNLKISKYGEGDVVLCGEILGVSFK